MLTTLVATIVALALPPDFDPGANLLYRDVDSGRVHPITPSAGFAARLVASGTPEDITRVIPIIDAVLACQETREGHPHRGNFRWYLEDEMIEDLNAVQFVLGEFIPMMLRHGERLPSDSRTRLLTAIRLGLEEIERLDVLVAYTNITAKDVLNSCLGGELLGDMRISERGQVKMARWMAFTDQWGTALEFNSPTYTRVTLVTLGTLAQLVRDEATRIRAETMAARLGLSVALHIHTPTGRWAGPHSRAYHPTVTAETDAEIRQLTDWVKEGLLPGWIMDAIARRADGFDVIETAYPPMNLGLTTHHARSFTIGTSVAGLGEQSNVMIAHYVRPGSVRPGVFYTRYLTNDKWLGDFRHQTDRVSNRVLADEGRFLSVQNGSRAIGLYSPRALGRCTSAKAALIWTDHSQIDEIWIGDRRVTSLPAELKPGDVGVIGSGKVFFAVRPFTVTDLGHGAPLRLVERNGDLVLELHNYLGPAKSFWNLTWPGAFYQGQPQCGFYVEMAERALYADGSELAGLVAKGTFMDRAAPPYTYSGEGERHWLVAYQRDGIELGLEVDLMNWKLIRRWNEAGDLGWPMLESDLARQNRTGRVQVGDAVLTCRAEPAWLFGSAVADRWVAGYHGTTPSPVHLRVPGGSVEIESMGTGTVVWDRGEVKINALDVQGEARVTRDGSPSTKGDAH